MCDFRKALILDTYYLGELSYALWESIQEDTDILTDILNNKQRIIDFIVGYLEELLDICGCEDFLIWNEYKNDWELVSEYYVAGVIYEHYIKYDIEYYLEKNKQEMND